MSNANHTAADATAVLDNPAPRKVDSAATPAFAEALSELAAKHPRPRGLQAAAT